MAALAIGAAAPAFELPTGDGRTIALDDFRGKKVVLYFYPKDDTPGCTKEACSFQENLAAVKIKGAAVLGVSIDSPASHAKFSGKNSLSFPLLSDEKKTVVRKYGVWKKKSMYGKTYMGVERTTFIINEKGRITSIFPRVKVVGHTREVLDNL